MTATNILSRLTISIFLKIKEDKKIPSNYFGIFIMILLCLNFQLKLRSEKYQKNNKKYW